MDSAILFESHYEFIENLAPLSNNLPALSQFLDENCHPEIRKMALDKIAQIPNPTSEKLAKKALNDSNTLVAQSALSALYELKSINATSSDTNLLLERLAKLQWELDFKEIDSMHGKIIKTSIINALKT